MSVSDPPKHIMSGEQSVRSDEASDFRKVLERTSPASGSPRSELLSDFDSNKAQKVKTYRSSSYERHRSHRDRDRVTDVNMVEAHGLSRVTPAEMRKIFIHTSKRLEQEIRRANDAERRAREAEARASAMQLAKQKAQAEVIHEQKTLKAYEAQLAVAREEILRAQTDLNSMAADRDRAEEAAAKDRSNARAMAKEIEIHQALEKGRQEGKIQGFVDGRKEGWYIGTRDGKREALRELLSYEDAESVSSRSSTTPPPFPAPGNHAAAASAISSTTRLAAPGPVDIPPSMNQPETNPNATSTRTPTSHSNHKRSGSFTQNLKARLRRTSDSKPSSVIKGKSSDAAPTSVRKSPSSERLVDQSRSTQTAPPTSRDPGRISPVPLNPPPSPRPTLTSPLGLIPLQENGRFSLPPPHDIDPPPPSPHSPAIPLPPEITYNALLDTTLQPPNVAANFAPSITVQEPTPPEPPVTMPEPHPAPFPSGSLAENNVQPSHILSRDYAFGSRAESPPLPPLPSERGGKGKQRQRQARSRGASGLHAPGRSSPSDTSTEISQFDIVTANGATEQLERSRLNMARGSGSKLSVIMEVGSTAAESPEPAPVMGVRQQPTTPRLDGGSPLSHRVMEEVPRSPSRHGILHDPREYGDLPEAQLSPSQLAQRQVLAEQLRWSTPQGDPEIMNGMRNIRDDISIKTSTTRASAPRRRPNVRMPERLGPSRDVEVLEKQAEMYDAFGTGQFPHFERLSSPDDAVSTRTPPEFKRGHRRAVSSVTTVPDITIQPPSRPSSHASKVSDIPSNLSPHRSPIPMPVPGTPSRRHSMQGPPMTPSMVPLPQTTPQVPMTLETPYHGEFTLPAGFVPTQGPPQATEEVSSEFPSRTPHVNVVSMSTKIPGTTSGLRGGPPNFPGNTPAGIPLPLSTATTHRGLPDTGSSAPRGTGRSSRFELPNVAATSYEPATLPPGTQYPPSFAPARVPLPESVAGYSPRPSTANQTPWGEWSGVGAGASPSPSMPTALGAGRPIALYAGDGNGNKKVSSASFASLHNNVQSNTYLYPDILASTNSAIGRDGMDDNAKILSRSGSVRSTSSVKDGQKSPYAASVETVTDDDDTPHPQDT